VCKTEGRDKEGREGAEREREREREYENGFIYNII
jgi:hypothetical protein